MPLTYVIDQERGLVIVTVPENAAPRDLILFYTAILDDDRFQPTYRFLIDRRALPAPPTAESVRAILAYLQTRADRLGVSRMAIVVPVGTPPAPWRNAEVLAGYYTPLTLRLFEDYDDAEQWALEREA